jgi:HTH-type transcriptional regulator/antitoxin HigA
LNLESGFQLSKVEPAPDRIAREARLRERFPIKEMMKRGWLQPSPNFEVIEQAAYRFFGISSIEEAPALGTAFRRNPKKELSNMQLAWLFRVKQIATALQTPEFSEAGLRAAIPRLEALMTEPEEIRHVPRVLTECGVRFVIVEPMVGSDIQGVCFWVGQNRTPVIGLTMKYDRIDNFWFNLRHEIEHVLRGDGKEYPMIDENPLELDQAEDRDAEICANTAAAEFCAPQKMVKDFILRHDPIYSETALTGFARIIRRHPGIVAGQVQNLTQRHDIYRKHLIRIRACITSTALTDGFGKSCPYDI